jgi:excisionase family DNA binding protein
MIELKPADKLCLSQAEAAAYIGVSLGTFLSAVKRGEMPQPKSMGARKLWVRAEIERAFGLQSPSLVEHDAPSSEWNLDDVE